MFVSCECCVSSKCNREAPLGEAMTRNRVGSVKIKSVMPTPQPEDWTKTKNHYHVLRQDYYAG
jgi:hypothetical protein